jgi:hypothetical protein
MYFMGLGVDYYVAGRSIALTQRMPLVGNLFHHAIEMMLKARMAHRYSLRELAREFRHDLPRLWEAFKPDFPNIDLREFDETVRTLAAFERIRYPDNVMAEGMRVRLDWTKPDPAWASTGREPEYSVVVNDIDRLMAKIFEVSSRNPFFFTNRLNDYARSALTHLNPVVDLLLERR